MTAGRVWRGGIAAALLLASLAMVACGKSNKATPLAVTLKPAGKGGKFEVPKSVKGGLVEVTFHNKGKALADAQLIRLEGGHTVQDLLKTVRGKKIPEWIHGGGGVGITRPGKTDTATVNLPAGSYVVFDDQGASEGQPPTYASLKVTQGDNGDLPSSTADITAKTVAKDKYAWNISGLKAGDNTIKFSNDSKNELHHVQAVRVTDPKASLSDVKKAIAQEGPPPKGQKPPIDPNTNLGTAALDGKTDEVTHLNLQKGKYVFVCFFNDRDGGKPHFLKGLAKFEEIK
jgi:hypothetical protein